MENIQNNFWLLVDNIFNVYLNVLSKTETISESYSGPNVTNPFKEWSLKPSYGLISGPPFSPRKKVDCFDTQNAEETDSGKYCLYSVVFLKVWLTH